MIKLSLYALPLLLMACSEITGEPKGNSVLDTGGSTDDTPDDGEGDDS